MHPKDKVPDEQRKDLAYHWECQADSCKSSYIEETSRAFGDRVKEHGKSATSAILKHCTDFHHPLPVVKDFNVIDKDPYQITREAKEAIHISRLDPNIKRNIGKMSIPHCLTPNWCKTQTPLCGPSLTSPPTLDEIVPPLKYQALTSPNLTILAILVLTLANIYTSTQLELVGQKTCSVN